MMIEPSLPFNRQVYTMTCANDAGAVRTAVHVSTTAQTSDIPDLIDTLYQRLAAQGYHTWLYDSAVNTRTDQRGLVDGTTIPVLADLIADVERAYETDDSEQNLLEERVSTTRRSLDALLTYCRLIAGIVPEDQRCDEVRPFDDDAIAALFGPDVINVRLVETDPQDLKGLPTIIDEAGDTKAIYDALWNETRAVNPGWTKDTGEGYEDPAEWATPEDVRELLDRED